MFHSNSQYSRSYRKMLNPAQKSTMKKSDNVDDHVFMPGDKIGEAFMTENAEKSTKANKDDKDKELVLWLSLFFEIHFGFIGNSNRTQYVKG